MGCGLGSLFVRRARIETHFAPDVSLDVLFAVCGRPLQGEISLRHSNMAFKFHSFSRPDVLKQFQPEILLQLLTTARFFFEMRGFRVPEGPDGTLDYPTLAGILAEPDDVMPSDLIEALHLISELGTDEQFDDLLELATGAGVVVPDDTSAADLAARIWLKDRRLLERKEREGVFERRKTFHSFRAKNSQLKIDVAALPPHFSDLEEELDAYFRKKKKGAGCRIIARRTDRDVRFLVQHGQPIRREPTRVGRESTVTIFRPERTDIVILDPACRELRINANSTQDLRKLKDLFGLYLFEDSDAFVYAAKYSLEPLRVHREASLRCRDIEGIAAVRVRQVELGFAGENNHIRIEKANDIFKALATARYEDNDPIYRKAIFSVNLEGEKRPRTLSVREGNTAAYQRGDESAVIENWMTARGFILIGSGTYEKTA